MYTSIYLYQTRRCFGGLVRMSGRPPGGGNGDLRQTGALLTFRAAGGSQWGPLPHAGMQHYKHTSAETSNSRLPTGNCSQLLGNAFVTNKSKTHAHKRRCEFSNRRE